MISLALVPTVRWGKRLQLLVPGKSSKYIWAVNVLHNLQETPRALIILNTSVLTTTNLQVKCLLPSAADTKTQELMTTQNFKYIPNAAPLSNHYIWG